MRCSACHGRAVIRLDYAGRDLCRSHFTRLFERRVKRELREQLRALGLGRGARIGVALSGGKDSMALLWLVHAALGRDPRFALVPIAVDEGIEGYRAQALGRCRDLVAELGLPLHVVGHAEDHGVTTDEVASANGARPCAACGVMRRASIAREASRLSCDAVATGHNLDDLAETTLMNLARGDLDQVLRTAPHAATIAGLAPRIVPLRTSPEREVALYATLRGLPFHDQECPHALHATRRTYRNVLLELLDANPSVRHAMLSLTDELKRRVAQATPSELGVCRSCGGPAADDVCRACHLAADASPSKWS